jgi:hypothetical protein
MFKSKGRHVKVPGEARWVGPLFALEALRVTYAAKREMRAASSAQDGGAK